MQSGMADCLQFTGYQDEICAKMCQKVSENIKRGSYQVGIASVGGMRKGEPQQQLLDTFSLS